MSDLNLRVGEVRSRFALAREGDFRPGEKSSQLIGGSEHFGLEAGGLAHGSGNLRERLER